MSYSHTQALVELDKAMRVEANRRNVWLMKCRPAVNQDGVAYRIQGRPVEFSGLMLLQVGKDPEAIARLVRIMVDDAYKQEQAA